jgi:hypothetical protein
MKDICQKKYIEEKLGSLKVASKIIKEIDFLMDIDEERSGKYRLNTANNSLEFLYTPVEEISKDKFIIINGEIEKREEGIYLKSNLNDVSQNYNMPRKEAVCFIDYKLDFDNIDCLSFDFSIITSNPKFRFYIPYIEEFGYKILCNVKDRLNSHREVLRSPESNAILYSFLPHQVQINEYIGQHIINNLVTTTIKNDKINWIVNFQNNQVNCLLDDNIKKLSLYYEDRRLTKRDRFYLLLENYDINCPDNAEVVIKKIETGNSEGYIYFNAMNISYNKARIIMLYSGSPCVECFFEQSNSWIGIDNSSLVNLNDNNLKLRIKMHTGDRVYRILICEE